VGVQDPSAERPEDARSDQPHVTGQHDHVRPRTPKDLGQRLVAAILDQRRIDPLLPGPVEGRAGTVREHQDDVATQLAALRRGMQRPQVRARARHADRDPPGHAIDSNRPSR
jgi:hypothetical protein